MQPNKPLLPAYLYLIFLSFFSLNGFVRAAEVAYIDIHYGDELIGAVLAEFDESRLRLDDPSELISLLPAVVDETYLQQILASDIAYQSPSTCTSEIYQRCFREGGPKVIVTFDPQLFIANVYLATDLLKVFEIDVDKFLPTFKSKPTYLASFGGVYSASSNDLLSTSENYNANLKQVVSLGSSRFNSEVGYANSQDFYIRDASFVNETKATRFIAGRYEFLGNPLIPSQLVQGFGIHSTTDLRLDLDQNGGSRIDVFVPQRSRVELYRDGRLISSAYYDVGNQQLDVSNLPDGAYDLEIRIIANGVVIEERTEFFTKSSRLPPVGENQTSFDFGQIATPLKLGTESDSHFVRLGHDVRLNDPGFLQLTAIGTQNWIALQSGYNWITRNSIGQVNSQFAGDGYKAIAFAISHRWQSALISLDWARASVPAGNAAQIDPFRRFSESADISSLRYTTGDSRRAFQGAIRFLASESGNERVTSMTAHMFPLEGDDRFKVSGSTQHSTRSGFQLSIDFLWRQPFRSAHVWARTRWINRNGQRVLSAVGMSGNHSDSIKQTAFRYGAIVEEFEDSKNLQAGTYYRNRLLSTDTDLNYELGGEHNRSMSTSLYSAFAVSDNKLKLFSDVGSGAGIVVSFPDVDDNLVSVVVNESHRVSVAAGTTQFIPLEPYRHYIIRVQPASGGDLEYDMHERIVVLYPGHVPVLEWRGNKVIAVFGQMRIAALAEDAPVDVVTSRGRDRAENGGYFAADVSGSDPVVRFVQNGELLCEFDIDIETADNGLLDLGTVLCQ